MPGIVLPDRGDDMDAYKRWRQRQDDESAAAQVSPKTHVEGSGAKSPPSAPAADRELAEFAALVLKTNSARRIA